jgi:hypothetical protein
LKVTDTPHAAVAPTLAPKPGKLEDAENDEPDSIAGSQTSAKDLEECSKLATVGLIELRTMVSLRRTNQTNVEVEA